MEQIDETTRIYHEGEHVVRIIKALGFISFHERPYGCNIEVPYGYKLISTETDSEGYTCFTFVNEVPVKCKEESLQIDWKYIRGYFSPGEVIKEMNLRKKY